MVLACDFIKMQTIVLEHLITQFKNRNGYEAICFVVENPVQPLCAI